MYEKYDVIIGFGEPLINSYKSNCVCERIYYGTGMHVCHQNHATLKRAKDVYKKRKVWLLNSTRLVEKTWSVQTTLVDAMIMFGNETVVESYAKYFDKPIYNIPLSCYEMMSIEDNEQLLHAKDYEQAKRKFIFMSSAGMVHRSLDLLLEIFSENPQWELHICAPIDKEPEFKKIYYDELYNTPNIHTHGFVQLNSNLFIDLIKKSSFCVFPSCSEGVAGSVINLMAHGIIPIVTDEASINPYGFVINIKSISKQKILNSLNHASAISNEKILAMSLACLKHTRANHSIDAYKQGLSKALKAILG
ncbi:MAG: glycosyltransferase [Deltaproteobacteria bacterium]|nr:glycosyltransferase [Deltaproteobacteria bacterium]